MNHILLRCSNSQKVWNFIKQRLSFMPIPDNIYLCWGPWRDNNIQANFLKFVTWRWLLYVSDYGGSARTGFLTRGFVIRPSYTSYSCRRLSLVFTLHRDFQGDCHQVLHNGLQCIHLQWRGGVCLWRRVICRPP